MKVKYDLEERPPLKENLIYGLQWLAITIPAVIIFGKLLGGMQGTIAAGLLYMQKSFAVTAVSILLQIFWGHRLPLVIGPATVLLIGILASQTNSSGAIYSSIMICGLVLTLLAASGLFASLRRLFTPRVVAVILLLIAFTMMPTIMKLISSSSGESASSMHLGFALVLILLMFTGQRLLTGLWKATLILWAIIFGSLAYFLLNPTWIQVANAADLPLLAGFFDQLTTSMVIDPGLIIAFLLCFLGLSINDLGSIQAVGSVLQADEMPKRITRGITFTGLSNALAGFMGVIGPVNFSFSPGVIASTGCAARSTFIPAGITMLALAFLPKVLFYLSFIPEVVIGCILLFIMCTQVAAGLTTAFTAMEQPYFDYALLIGLPILIGIMVAFLPAEVVASFPARLRPILANGFVMGVIVSLLLEHVIFRGNRKTPQ
ncbi:uracil-xanthine permease family protein [Sporomusa acidovorans]|uniref:Nucleobase transporter PlUacP n=1 Tax=Sporomusa acidovorans (strain ATCC 49682 / DSM 3132 / Mol) TaxID=1123286 RepID=A0ABZ3JBQ3_SPOA4|nr:solute carrier family 23 protein [Sporomusa acidovorans]OZC13215.1 putative purine permease YbbY [Sporomusa acidovorans DSM 3132]SDE00921.1 Xanthine/uracil permease [Sporomusa acidovorans]